MKLIRVFLFSFFLSACGESPLLNHKLEGSGLGNEFFQTRGEGYHFSTVKYSFSLDWTVGPVKGESKVTMKTWSDDKGSLSGPYQNLPEKLHVYLWMPEMGHGSSPVSLKNVGTGEYEISNVYFIMGGKWQLFFQQLKNDKVIDEVIIPIDL